MSLIQLIKSLIFLRERESRFLFESWFSVAALFLMGVSQQLAPSFLNTYRCAQFPHKQIGDSLLYSRVDLVVSLNSLATY